MSKTRVAAIPAPTDANLREVARAVKNVLDVREGLLGDPLDSNVTFRDLIDGGIASVSTVVRRPGGSGSAIIITPPTEEGYDPTTDLTPPPAPTGFQAEGLFAAVLLSWVKPENVPNFAYTEIWRSSTNVIGDAVLIATTPTTSYVDFIGGSQTRYYWVRFVTQANVTGPYNATSGTEATTADDPAFLLSILADSITESELAQALRSRIDLIDGSISLDGSVDSRIADAIAPDLTPPPTPSSFTATAGIMNVLVNVGGIVYSQGHGHRGTALYGYRGATPSFAAATFIGEFQGVSYSFPSEPSTTWHLWAKFVTNDGVYSTNPAGGATGVQVTTGQDVSLLMDALDGEITNSQLAQSLATRINLIDDPSGVAGSVNARIAAEQTARAQEIAQESSDRAAAINAEAAARAAADAAEAAARVQAISNEQQTRADAIAIETAQRISQVQDAATSALQALLAVDTEQQLRLADVALARQELTEDIQQGLLAEATQRTTLASQLRGSYTGSDLGQLTTGLLFQERLARSTQDNALAQQITLLSAGAGEQFDWQTIWYFDSGVEGWTGNGTPTVAQGWLRPADQASDAHVVSPSGIAADGSRYGQVRLRIRKTGNPTFAGFLWWRTSSDSTWDTSRRLALTAPTFDANGIGLVTVNVGWTITVDRIRVDLSSAQTATDYFDIDWVAIGRPSPGASSAQLLDEQEARANADSAEVTARQALSSKLTGVVDPATLTLGTLSSGLLYDERQARSTADTALSQSITTLDASVGTLNSSLTTVQTAVAGLQTTSASTQTTLISLDKRTQRDTDKTAEAILHDALAVDKERVERKTTLAIARQELITTIEEGLSAEAAARLTLAAVVNDNTAAITEEQVARATADSALSQSLTTLTATVGSNTAAITAEQTARVDADTALSTQITTLSSTVDSNQAALVQNYYTKTAANSATASAQQTLITNYGASNVFRQTSAPAQSSTNVTLANGSVVSKPTLRAGDLWFDTDDGNKPHVWSGSAWVYSPDTSASASTAYIDSLDTALATANRATINSFRTAVAKVDIPEGSLSTRLTTDYNAIAGPTGAIATNASFLRAYADIQSKVFRQASAPTSRGTDPQTSATLPLKVGDAWFDSDDSNKPYVWNGSAWVESRDGAIGTVDARVTSVETTKIGYCTIGGLATDQTTKQTCEAAGGTWNVGLPMATAVKQVSVSDGASSATLEQRFQAQKTTNDGLLAQYTVKIDNNGFVSGFGLASTLVGATPTSDFIVNASKFAVASPTGPGIPQISPFKVVTTTIPATATKPQINPGVYINGAFIEGGTISGTQILGGTIENSKLINVSADKITGAALLNTAYIESAGYVAGSSGWKIHGNGTAEFSGVTVRGTIEASSGNIGGVLIDSTRVRSPGMTSFSAGNGFWLGNDGRAQIGVATGSKLVYDGTNVGVYLGSGGRFELTGSGGSGITFNGSSLNIVLTDGGNAFSVGARVNSLGSMYTVKMDNAGVVSGFGLSSSIAEGGAVTSKFIVNTNQFAVIAPNRTLGNLNSVPFAVLTTPQTINGVNFAAGVYIDGGSINDATITKAKIGSVDADTIQAGFMQTVDLTGSTVHGSELFIGGTVTYEYNYPGQPSRITGIASVANPNVALRASGAEFQVGFFKIKTSPTATADTVFEVVGGVTQIKNAVIGTGTITSANIADTIQSTNWNAGSNTGWQINKAGTATFNNVTVRGAVFASSGSFTGSVTAAGLNGGSFTGYAWPASGTGFHISPSGLLLGNYNTGRYFQVEAGGNVYAPGLSIVNGSATFSGTLSANTVNTDNIVGAAVSSGYATSAGSAATSCAVTVVIPAGTSSVIILGYTGTPYIAQGGSGKDIYQYTAIPPGTVTVQRVDIGGQPVQTVTTQSQHVITSINGPTAGTYVVTLNRDVASGPMNLAVVVNKR